MSKARYGDRPIRLATHCHVCYVKFEDGDAIVEHGGAAMVHNDDVETNGNGSIVLHPECATLLAMRMLHDVMNTRNSPHMRVVDALRNIREAYEMK